MITLQLEQAREDLPALAEKALLGEVVFIAVGGRTLRLTPVADAVDAALGPRRGRESWKIEIPDAFYDPWTDEEMGEPGA